MANPDDLIAPGSYDPNLHVPGMWRCAKCNFVLIQSNLNANDGSVTPRDQAGDYCPNDGAPLWRLTWREHATDLGHRLEETWARLKPSEANGRPSDDDLLPHLPETVRAAKRCGMQQSAWLTGWFVPWSPRNSNENAEGPWSDWLKLAEAIFAADEQARAAFILDSTNGGQPS